MAREDIADAAEREVSSLAAAFCTPELGRLLGQTCSCSASNHNAAVHFPGVGGDRGAGKERRRNRHPAGAHRSLWQIRPLCRRRSRVSHLKSKEVRQN